MKSFQQTLKRYRGRNGFGEISNLAPGDFRRAKNIDLYQGPEQDFFRNRRGSRNLQPADPIGHGAPFQNGVVFAVGDTEYLITQEATLFYAQEVYPNVGNPAVVVDVVSGDQYAAGDEAHDFEATNEKVYAFAQTGNVVIAWSAANSRFEARPLGLSAPVIESIDGQIDYDTPGQMPPTGQFYYGFEKVYRLNDADVVASSPRRRLLDGTIRSFTPGAQNALGITIQDESVSSDPYWTHLRGWRSRNAVPDLSDPLFPIAAQGTADQLGEFCLITRAEFERSEFLPVATGVELPPGNALTWAGLGFIVDGNPDSSLVDFADLDRIDLVPIPPARTGTVHPRGVMFVSGVNEGDIDPELQEDILYSDQQYTAYAEQWDPQAFLPAGRNGQKTTMLQVFGDDLLIGREGETRRLPGGNIDAGIQMVDDKIGVLSYRMAGFVTGLGIAAICSDKYFRYLGLDYQWHQVKNGVEISQSIYDLTSTMPARIASFIMANGKLIMVLSSAAFDPVTLVLALHIKEGRAWTQYEFPGGEAPRNFHYAFTFASGQRMALVPDQDTLLEIEVDTDTDELGQTDPELIKVAGEFETSPFLAPGGILDLEVYSFWGKLSNVATVTARSSNLEWQMRAAYQDPALFAATPDLTEREYRYNPEPKTLGSFRWVPLRGVFLSLVVKTSGAFMISWQTVKGTIRPAAGGLGVYPDGGVTPQGPGWANPVQLLLNFMDPGESFADASGKGNSLAWGGAGTKVNRVDQKPGKGLQMADGGYIARATDPAVGFLGGRPLTFKCAFSFRDDWTAELSWSGRNAAAFYWLRVTRAGATMTVFAGSQTFRYTAAATFDANTVYALTFSLTPALLGAFYFDKVSGSGFAGLRQTVREVPTELEPAAAGDSSALIADLAVGGAWDGQRLYGRLTQAFQFWTLYGSAADRDDQVNPVGYFSGPGPVFAFTAQGDSGITGSLGLTGDLPYESQDLDIISSPAPAVTGTRLQVDGIVSYAEITAAAYGAEQAGRFLGMVRAS